MESYQHEYDTAGRMDMNMKKQMLKKLRSKSGESIAETLVAVLIAALALLMLAGTINTASRLITRSKTALDAYYTENNKLSEHSSSNSSGTSTVTVSSGAGAADGWISCTVDLYKNDKIGSAPVVAFSRHTGS